MLKRLLEEDGLPWRLVTAYRRPLVVGAHLALWTASFLGAFALRFEFAIPWEKYVPILWLWLAADLACRAIVFHRLGLFQGLWRYSGMPELTSLFNATTASTAMFAVFVVLGGYRALPRSVFVIDWAMSMLLLGGLRFGIRAMLEARDRVDTRRGPRERVLVVGAGETGALFVRQALRHRVGDLWPVGFVDDDPRKAGQHIHGVRVLGSIADVAKLAETHEAEGIVIALPSIAGNALRDVIATCESAGVPVRIVPSYSRLEGTEDTPVALRPIHIEDLLRRAPVDLDDEAIAAFVRGRRVLVTGAGGSIGSELVRQILGYAPERIVLLDQAEIPLEEVHRSLTERVDRGTTELVARLASVRDADRLRDVFARDRPNVVFHAAAHKHVPMVERNPGEAIRNNVFGTKTLADLSVEAEVENFVMISTDKAVNPSSVMGVSKRLAEIYIQALATSASTRFETVRFGNVLGSAGSVVPIFEEQIARGGPVTVTHPEMRRYFMTIPEACQLVLQAATMGKGGEIFILDMGEPVRIVDLARDLIRLKGLEPDADIRIEFVGVRAGEKLFEELSVAEERADKTRHPMIYTGRQRPVPLDRVLAHFAELERLAVEGSLEDDRSVLRELVPEYQPTRFAVDRTGPTPVPPAPPDRRESSA